MVVFMKTNAVGLRPCTAMIPHVSEIKGLARDFYFTGRAETSSR